MYSSDFEDLIGKKILSVEYSEETLRFNLEGDAIAFRAVGDCCSTSYIESIDNPEIFKSATLLSVEAEVGEQKEVEDGDYHEWTFYKFKTDKGMATLSFRNESNGYYSGWLERVT